MHSRKKILIVSLLIVIAFLFSGLSVFDQGMNFSPNLSGLRTVNANAVSIPQASLRMVPVSASNNSTSSSSKIPYDGDTSVMVTFSFQNQSILSSLLSNLSNPNSSQYHRFITRSQFASKFAVSRDIYAQAVSYFKHFPDLSVYQYGDRVSLEVKGPAKEVGKAFNTTIAVSPDDSKLYFASSTPELPLYLAKQVSQVTGLSDSRTHVNSNLFSTSCESSPKISNSANNGFPSPITRNGVQYVYGSDLQVAYDEQSLLNTTFPTNEVIATILWAGHNSTGMPVGAFDPSDIYTYYNATLPSYEPHSKIYGVPLNGALKPGVSASYDVTGANKENTLDLEMVGSTAPGSSIYNVYGPNATMENIDSSFAFILNPNSTYSALNNVSVITNSWGTCEYNNTVWYQYLQEAQARGITVLASSGDSGDNNASSKYTGSQLEFPAAMAYNTFGVTAVGGTTLTVTQNLHILNQTAWYISSNDSADRGPAGSVGGISTVFKEPDFQLNTEANNLLHGMGRGVPDISAVANNTIVYITVNGVSHYSHPAVFWGTSVASPVEAGIIAEIDAVLNHYKQPTLGYLNPMIYNMANKQITSPTKTSTVGFIKTGSYNSSLPSLPFYNVIYGRNHVYNATFGYNLVTGWGSIDAYNLTMYILNINRSQSQNGLEGVYDKLSLEGLNVTSYLYDPSTDSYTINTNYNASIQQNLFLANQFGAPLYWIQNVVYINGSQSAGWVVHYTGWVVYPFFGQYPSQAVYEYKFPIGKFISMPHVFNVRTWISNLSDPMHQTVNFQLNSQIITLPVPGAAYIIDSHISSQNYSYTWQGKTYYNGPYPDNPNSGGLNPQFGLVGGPSGGLGFFGNATRGTISAYVEPMDSDSYVSAVSKVLNRSVDETGEIAESLNFVRLNTTTWGLSVKQNSQSQGLVDYAPAQYSQTFEEKGLPSGTTWYVNLSNGQSFSSSTSTILLNLVNGTYPYTIGTTNKIFSASGGTLTVSGNTVHESVTFSKVTYTATFTETGLPSGTTWYVNGTNLIGHETSPTNITFMLTNGTYTFTISNLTSYYTTNSQFTVTINGSSFVEETVHYYHRGSSISSTEIYAIAGIIAAVAVIGGVVMIIRKRK